MRRRLTIVAVVLVPLAVLVGGAVGWLFFSFDRPGPLTKPVAVVIPRDLSIEGIGRLPEDKRVVADARVFSLGTRLTGNASALQPGEYEFGVAFSPRTAMNLILSGKRVAHKLTVPEGLTTVQILKIVGGAEGLEGPITITPGEGTLLPETYQYFWGDSRDNVIERMTHAFDETLATLWAERSEDGILKSPDAAVVLASIIAREAGGARERLIIASVLINRLKRGMRLESDVTVAYGIALADHLPDDVLKRKLTRKDLKRPTPYNTYLNKGLPPTPICNPGREAIRAALHPAKTNYLFFAAGENGSKFARTAAEHARNIAAMKEMKGGENEARLPDSLPGP
jgi:UPF0755 protein